MDSVPVIFGCYITELLDLTQNNQENYKYADNKVMLLRSVVCNVQNIKIGLAEKYITKRACVNVMMRLSVFLKLLCNWAKLITVFSKFLINGLV